MQSYSLGRELLGMTRQQRTATALQAEVTKLFEESRDDVYRYLITIGLPPAQAQETVQEVFLRLYGTMRKGEKINSPRGWIFRVAHNLALTIKEKQDLETPFDPALDATLASQAVGADRDLIERERMLRFHQAVDSLSEQQRRCLMLRMEGLRYPEIGETMGISPSAVGEFLRRAMLRLRKVRDE